MAPIIPVAWIPYLDDFTLALQAGAAPKTTIETRLNHLRRVARSAGAPSPLELTADQLTNWCGRQTWSTETRRGYRGSLLAFYRWGVGSGRFSENIADALPYVAPAKPTPKPAPDGVYAAALLLADRRGLLILRLGSEIGLRRAEIAVGHSRDIIEDLAGHSLLVHGKGNKDRVVPLPPDLARLLRELGPGYFFPGNDNGHLSPRWVGKIATELLPDEWTLHKLRHRFASRAYRATRNIRAVQRLLGHDSVATTQIYTAVDDDELRNTVIAGLGGKTLGAAL
ncbi:tyrosine-type recombinase/integrase [Rhodococcoides fascians]|uniref:tyrosine-type recombinase/integrase n=1 Tax=Rhodococcoides fascians TaxID=1828 RepID=UPI0009B8547E|nr:tyrosine-type recombinase/integrase [Rhodococcus fascians]